MQCKCFYLDNRLNIREQSNILIILSKNSLFLLLVTHIVSQRVVIKFKKNAE